MNEMQPWQSTPLVNLDRQGRAIVRQVNNDMLTEQGRAVVAARKAQNVMTMANGIMTGVDELRRHESRAAAEDPMVADEYARVRRLGADLAMSILSQYGTQPWV